VAQWLDSFYAMRDGVLSSPKFQRWASHSPLTRHVARKRAGDMFNICAGFVYSQILQACVKLDVFETLRNGPLTLDVLAPKLDLSRDAARRLLEGAVAIDLLSHRGPERYGLGPHGAALLANPGIARMVEHHAMLYADLVDPVAMLRGKPVSTHLKDYWAYSGKPDSTVVTPDQTEAYSALMSASQTFVVDEVLGAYPLAQHKVLLDIGGGDGTFLREVGRRVPTLNLMLFDLPAVAEKARAKFAAEGFGSRATAHGGSFKQDALPTGADIVSLIRVVHDHDDDVVQPLFASIYKALPASGVLLIAEPMSGSKGAEGMGEAYFGFYLMAMGSGRPRRPDELKAMLLKAGFARQRSLKTHIPLQTSIIVAEK
jgi:demethylspheroidene O-methyltransferase